MKSFQPFRLDEVNQCLWRGSTRISLMPKPFAVLRYLVNHAGRLVPHEELLNAIWPDTFVQPEVLRRYILEIRRVLGDEVEDPHFVETLPKRGYQFIAEVTDTTISPSGTPFQLPKLVGRKSALSDLDRYLERTIHGERQIVFISGEAGIGKTSLVDAFQQRAEVKPDIRVMRGQSVEGFGGKEAYYPIFEALAQLAKGAAGAEVIVALAKSAPTWMIQFPALVTSEQHAALQRETLGATRDRMVRELCEALELITQTSPLIIILEDLHWVDHSTVDLISAIARRRTPAKLFLLGTFRPADLILYDSPFKSLKQDLLLHHLGHELPLEPLNESDVAEYLATEFSDDLPSKLATAIHRHSDGNPLFMTAMLDHLLQNGVLSQDDGGWKLTTTVEELDPGVPETLRQMLELQLQHLSQDEQQLLKCASVAGEHFSAWSIATMMHRDPSDVEQQCSALAERQQFLKAIALRELSNGELTFDYEFRHALYREVLYRHLNPTLRVKFHRLLAEGLERLRSTAEPEAAAEIALHFEEGRDYQRAVHFLIVAADNATRRYAHREAIQALEHARALLGRMAKEQRQKLDVKILEKIGDAYYALGDMERSATTYHMMATQAAEAGLLTVQANALMRLAHSAEAIPFFLKAIELDPKFAAAYVSLSRIYSNLGEVERAREYARRAYEQMDQVTEREKFSIKYQYDYEVTGNQSDAAATLEMWKESFPEEFQPANSLAYMYNVLGQFERALEEGKEALRRNPTHGFPYSNLAHSYRGLGDFDAARETAEQAVALNIETLPTRRLLYQLAIMAGDHKTASAHVEWGRDRPREFEIVAARAQVACCSGKLQQARQYFDETVRMADARNLADVGTNHLSSATWMEMAYGNTSEALEGARRVLQRNPSYDPCLRVALTLSACGCDKEAETIVGRLVNPYPQHTIINCVLAPIVRAGIALARKQPAKAIEHLEDVAPYELGFAAVLAPIYLRANSYLMLGAAIKAANEFQRLLDHRGSEPFSPFYAVARLGFARALAKANEIARSRKAYAEFLAQWADADSGIPVVLEAKGELNLISTLHDDRSSESKTRHTSVGISDKTLK
jgi:DNA-binding winged helix-turn-helix (wHTH) protein/tetratricopeptide (TPR) repeat protein